MTMRSILLITNALVLRLVSLTSVVALAFQVAGAAAAPATTMTVGSMAEAVDALVARYGYLITLEEPKYLYAGDLEDLPAEVRRDLDHYPRGAAPKVLVPKRQQHVLILPATASVGPREVASLLQQLVRQQSTGASGAHYRLEQAGEVFHIVPTQVRDQDGNWLQQKSIFDTPISLATQERPVIDTVNAICLAVGTASHTPVNLAMAPMTMLTYSLTVVGAKNEPARDVLTRALSGMNRRLTWRVGYFGEMNSYLLIISVVPDNTSERTLIPAPAQAIPSGTAVSETRRNSGVGVSKFPAAPTGSPQTGPR